MRAETRLADEVQVTVSGALTTHHVLRTPTGPLGELTVPAFRSKAVFVSAEGRELAIDRTSWWKGTYELREAGTTLGTAHPLGIFRREVIVRFREGTYRLKATGFLGRVWRLLDDAAGPLVEIQPRGVFRRGAVLRILGSVDADLLVFAYHVVNARWQEQAATTASAAAAS